MADVDAANAEANEPDYKRLHAYSLVRNTGMVCKPILSDESIEKTQLKRQPGPLLAAEMK